MLKNIVIECKIRHSVFLDGITVRIFAANAPQPLLQCQHVDSDGEQFFALRVYTCFV
jgi:hypothetical protein